MNDTQTILVNQSIHGLRGAAEEIRSLRRHIIEVKAEAYDCHSELMKRLFAGGSQCVMGECPAHFAERTAAQLTRELEAAAAPKQEAAARKSLKRARRQRVNSAPIG